MLDPRSLRTTPAESPPPGAAAQPAANASRFELRELPEIAVTADEDTPIADQFRRLRGLLSPLGSNPAKVVTITSPVPGDGKSVVALNLALAFSHRSNCRTLLVDAELRKRPAAAILAPEPEFGLTDVLTGRRTLDAVLVRPRGCPLVILPAGALVSDPSSLLGSEACRQLVRDLRERFDQVILDTPPVVPFSDAVILAGLSDGTLLVARAEHTPRNLYDEAVSILGNVNVLGTVLNGARPNLADFGRSPDGYYRHYYQGTKK